MWSRQGAFALARPPLRLTPTSYLQCSSFWPTHGWANRQGNHFQLARKRRGWRRGDAFFATATLAGSDHASQMWSSSTHDLHLYNTMARKKQPFTTVEPGIVRFYSCGPTVYDYAHVGNFRAFLTYDVIKRWLICKGYEVRHVMNLTDVDDKIIKKVQQLGCTAEELTNKYADAFFADLDLLNIIRAQHYPRATEHIKEIEKSVKGLKERGYAYEREGSVYFAVSKFNSYGRLAQLDKRERGSLTAAAAAGNGAIDSDEYDKDDLRDFALWKSFKPEDGEVFWNTSLGKGRPGWHIECTCMAMRYLGPELDLHGGGIDLIFPHHENEIAQSEALTGRPFSRFWVHNGFVNIDNEKMSKSLGNFRTLRDIVRKPEDARAFRYMVISSQYRSALAFTEKGFKSAKSTIKRLDALRRRLASLDGKGGEDVITDIVKAASEDFRKGMDDDFNTPRAAAAMFSLVNIIESMCKAGQLGASAAKTVERTLDAMDEVFGIFYTPVLSDKDERFIPPKVTNISPELQALLEERAVARTSKKFARADEIRDEITAAGFAIIDTRDGAKLEPLNS